MEHHISLGYEPRNWQRELHIGKKRFTVAVVHRRGGKSHAAMLELLHCALAEPNTHYAYIGPHIVQAKRILWEKMKAIAVRVPHTEARETEALLRFANGSTIRVMGADAADGIRGLGFHGVVGDEFQLWKQDVLQQVVLPTLAGINGWLLLIGTPSGIDALTIKYEKALLDPEWAAFKFTVDDTQALTPDEIRVFRSEMSEAQFALEFMCDYQQASPTQLISREEVDRSAARTLMLTDYQDHPKIMAVDISRQGSDECVITRRQGPMVWEQIGFRDPSLMSAARFIALEYGKYQPDALFVDGGGLGAGAVDALLDMGIPVVEVQFGGKPMDNRYLNARAEMYYNVLYWIRRGGVLPHDPMLHLELTAMCHEQSDKGVLKLESKEELRQRINRSPDRADSLAMCFYCPVVKKPDRAAPPVRAKDDWEMG